MMKLNIQKRPEGNKKEAKRQRREGLIPAVIYSKGQPGVAITLQRAEWEAHLRNMNKDLLSTAVFSLEEEGKTTKVLVKAIQYHVTTYDVLHLDFVELHDDVPVNVNVPIVWKGAAECAGVKLGGVLRPVIRALPVRCLPKDLPTVLEIDVATLGLRQRRRLKTIAIPEAVRPLKDLNEVAVVVAKR